VVNLFPPTDSIHAPIAMKPEPKSSALPVGTDADEDLRPGEPRSWLSALADGDAAALDKACSAWRDDEDARRTWHAYHLIGDVMRSEELANTPQRDSVFLAGVRARLAAEPVVLAPGKTVAPRRRQPWLVPAAAAAGFVAVAGVMVMTRGSLPGSEATLQTVGAPAQALPAPPQFRQAIVRNPRLDEMLRAHELARGGVAVAAPGNALRRVELTTTPPIAADR
jgi:sigma-E factor negative regulatory protein RseA